MSFGPIIDYDACVRCGLCVGICPSGTLSLVDSAPRVAAPNRCLVCDHCAAVCPERAVSVAGLDDRAFAFETIDLGAPGSTANDVGIGSLVRLMRSRRSCRDFAPEPIDEGLLRDLVRIGTTAPSGTNSQVWSFTLVSGRPAVVSLASRISDFYRRLNRLANIGPLRAMLRLVGSPTLSNYYKEYHGTVAEALAAWDREGRDLLFFGAPACILIGSRPGGSSPVEDALLAASNILLAARAMELGTCLIGFAVHALAHDKRIPRHLGIPDDEKVHAVIAIGHPRSSFLRPTGRKTAAVRVLSR